MLVDTEFVVTSKNCQFETCGVFLDVSIHRR